MPLRLVFGPANAAKAGEVLGAFTAEVGRGALLVLPTAEDVRHYTREFAAAGTVFARVGTFPGLIAEIAAATGPPDRRLSELQRARVLRRAVASTELSALAAAASAPGFTHALGGLIAELQRALVTPQRLIAALRAWAAAHPQRDAYARELGALYGAYRRELDRIGRVDGELMAWRALDRLRERPAAWGRAPVFFYGFDDLLGIERDAIETLARHVGVAVTVSLTYEPGRVALAARAGAVEELRPLADEVVELPALDEHYAPESRPALGHLERTLFEPDASPRDPGDAVRLLEAGGARAEAELIAAEVLRLLRDGVAPGEIVIVARSLATAGPLLAGVLGAYGIPVLAPGRRALAHTALGRGLLGLARCAFDPAAPGDELMRYLRTPGAVSSPERLDALEARALREGLHTAVQLRDGLGLALGELDSLRDARDPLAEVLRQARRLLAAPRRGRAAVLDAAEERDAAALAALRHAAAELSELGDTLSAAELLELLETLQLADRATGGEDGVSLAEPLGIRARRFRAVFVCGLCEGELPRPSAAEPFLSDALRRELALASGLRLAPREEWLAPERYLFYTCVSRATERLTLSFRSSDEDGNLVLPSPFVGDLRAALGEPWYERRRRRLLADVTFAPDEAPTERERLRALAAAGAVPACGPPPRRLGARAMGHVRHRDVVSAGALEKFADCPVAWLVDAQLRPDALQPEADPLTRGTLVHAVLERTLARLGGPVSDATLGPASTILDAALDELVAERGPALLPGRSSALREAAVKEIRADLHRYLRQEAAAGCTFRPEALEQRFGFDDDPASLPPLMLGEEPDRVRVRGVIDRLDVDPGGGRATIVRDYKSSSARPEHQAGRWRSERRLQVGLYMLAVRELLGRDPVAGLYQPLRGRELRPRGAFSAGAEVGAGLFPGDARTPEELDALLDEVRADATGYVARLREGVLEPCPQTCSRDGCRYPGICRSS